MATTYAPKYSNHTPAMITPAQKNFIVNILAPERVLDATLTARLEKAILGQATKQGASDFITDLKLAPKKGAKQTLTTGQAAETKPGFYVREGEVFQVVISKSSGKPYAKKMVVINPGTEHVKGSWEYAPGIAKELESLTVLTAEEAGVLGKATGACMICGRKLTVGKSIEAGIGPVCAGKL